MFLRFTALKKSQQLGVGELYGLADFALGRDAAEGGISLRAVSDIVQVSVNQQPNCKLVNRETFIIVKL